MVEDLNIFCKQEDTFFTTTRKLKDAELIANSVTDFVLVLSLFDNN
jgi:hypothetical protein